MLNFRDATGNRFIRFNGMSWWAVRTSKSTITDSCICIHQWIPDITGKLDDSNRCRLLLFLLFLECMITHLLVRHRDLREQETFLAHLYLGHYTLFWGSSGCFDIGGSCGEAAKL